MTASGHRERERIVNEGVNGFDKIKGTHQSERTEQPKHTEGLLIRNPKAKMNKTESAEYDKADGYR